LNQKPGQNPWLRFQNVEGFGIEEEEDNIRNPITSLAAGLMRGLTEPLTIVPAVNRIAENLKPFYGDNWTSKVAYGLGFIGGTFVPGGLAFKVGGKVARSLGFVVKTADKVTDLTRVGKLTRGAVAGALYGAGMHADNVPEYARQILTIGALGSAGELVIPAALSAISARFGKKVNPSILALLEEEVAEQAAKTGARPRPVPTGTREGVALHARAMQLVEDMESMYNVIDPTLTGAQNRHIQALRDRGMNVPSMSVSPSAGRRLATELNVEQLNFSDLTLGQYRIVPLPHQDADVFQKLLGRLDDVSHQKIKRPDGEFVVVGLTEGFDRTVARELEQFGFMRGQEVIYKGTKWMALKPTKKGDGLWIAKVGRNKKPLAIKIKDARFLPIAQDITKPSVAKIQPLVAEFIEEHTLWPSQVDYNDAVKAFVGKKGMNTSEQLAFRRDLITKQRNALGKDDPSFGKVLKNMEKAAEKVDELPHPDGPLAELAATRGVVVREVWHEGGFKHVASDGAGQPLSPLLKSTDEMTEWLNAYQVEPPNLAPRGVNIADELVPGSGASSMPAHTTIDHSNAHWNPLLSAASGIMPRAKFLQFAQDALIKLGITDIKPFTDFFLPLASGRKAYLNTVSLWLKGGVLDDGTKVRGLLQIYNPKKPVIRAANKELFVDLLETPRTQWGKFAAEHGLNEKEVRAASEMREWLNQMFKRHVADKNITISGDDFIENYWPHYRRLADEDAPGSVAKAFGELFPGKDMNKPTMRFLSEMQRQGNMSKYDKDPFTVMLKYLRAGAYKSHMRETMDNAIDTFNKMPTNTKELQLIQRSMKDYIQLARYGAPEAFTSVNTAVETGLKMLNVKLDLTTQERIVNTYLTLNYGAYLGFRPGLALRNLYQTILTGMPLLGPKYLAYGMKAVFSGREAAFTKAKKMGALLTDHVPVFGDDMLYAEYQAANYAASGKVGRLEKLNRLGQRATNLGMRFYTSADTINRGVVSLGMRKKALDAWNKFGSKGEMDKFWSKSGINFFGPSIKEEFTKILRSSGAESAVDWIGARAAEDTQWIYQLGAGPSLFSHGFGRLFGQYGTWPSWYGAYMAQGIKNLKGLERASFLAKNIAVHKTIIMAGGLVGWNMSRWTGISSLTWMGGPFVDWYSDIKEIVSGITTSGEATAGRSIALSKFGLRDVGGDGAALLPAFTGKLTRGLVEGRIGLTKSEEIKDRLRFATYFLSAVTPGYLFFAKDAPDALKQEDLASFIGRALSIPLDTPGYSYPQVKLQGR
jgi:hypothetical protein